MTEPTRTGEKRTPEWRRLHRLLTDVIDNACCGYDAAEDVLDALGLEQVGFVHPRRAMTHRFHTVCSGEESASGVSLYDDHTACFPVYTVGTSARGQESDR